MTSAGIAMLAAALVALQLPAAPPAYLLWCVSAAGAVAFARLDRSRWWSLSAWSALGFVLTVLQVQDYVRLRWPEAREGHRMLAEVIVESIPVERGETWSFVGSARPVYESTERRVLITSRDLQIRPRAGERWQLVLAMRTPHVARNPGGADLEAYFLRERIHARATVVRSRLNGFVDAGNRPLTALRERIARHIEGQVLDREAAALIAALAVGATGAMSREQWRVFNATGTSHLVAISGLHVTLFAVVAFAVTRWLWSTVLWRWAPWPRENVAGCVALVAALCYAALAGLSVPTQRTLLMLAAWLLARFMARAQTPFAPFGIALVAVLLLDPLNALAPGFWLSFGAMAAIIVVTCSGTVRQGLLREAITVQAGVTAALAPLTLALFGAVSVIGVLVNVVAIPLIGWIFVPAILAALVLLPVSQPLSDLVLRVVAGMHELGWPWLVAAADHPIAVLHLTPSLWWYGAAAAAVSLSLLPWPLRLRLAFLLPLVPLAVTGPRAPAHGAAELTILDAGEGTAVVVRTAGHTALFETGEVFGTEGRTVERVVLPFLKRQHVRSLDAVLLSRLSAVTSSGATALLAELEVGQWRIGSGTHAGLPDALPCRPGDTWEWEGVRFLVISGACALAVEVAGHRVVLMSRLEPPLTGADLQADAIVVPRGDHGSTASHALIQVTQARWAVVPGRRMRDGRPRADVARWQAEGASVLATGELGALRVRIDPFSGVHPPERLHTHGRQWWRASP